MKQLNTQAMEKALGHIVQNLGVDCLKDSKRFHSAVADLLPGFEYKAERKGLCACICLEVSEKLINEKQYTVLNGCVKYLTSQQKLTEQQANELVKVFTHILWKEASSNTEDNVTVKNTNQATVGAAAVVRQNSGLCVFEDINAVEQEKRKKAAKQGDAYAQYNLGTYYYCEQYNGHVNKNKDYVEAVKWFRRAVEQGHNKARFLLGECYYYGLGVNKDYKEAVLYFRKASEQEPNIFAWFYIGNCYYYGGYGISRDYAEAVKWYRKAAEQGVGDPEAKLKLGFCYYFGRGVSKDCPEAAKWWRKAAEQGNADAKACLQRFCKSESSADNSNNIGQKAGLEFAADLYRKAKQGDAKSQCELGKCYYYGRGVSKDYTNAAVWFRKAAEQGDNDARQYLRQLGENTSGLPKTQTAKGLGKSETATNSSVANLINIIGKAGSFFLSMIFFSFVAAVSIVFFDKFLCSFFTILSIISYICAVYLFSDELNEKYSNGGALLIVGLTCGLYMPVLITNSIVQLLMKYFM